MQGGRGRLSVKGGFIFLSDPSIEGCYTDHISANGAFAQYHVLLGIETTKGFVVAAGQTRNILA